MQPSQGRFFLYPAQRLLIHFKKYIRFGWLGFAYSRLTCKAVNFGSEMDNPSTIFVWGLVFMNNVNPVVGVDVAKDFCYYCVLSPDGKKYLEPFKAFNTKEGLDFVLEKLKKVEKAFKNRPVIVLESTGHYSARLVHLFGKNEFEVFLVNPLQSHSIKNSSIRKVKNDKADAEELARLYFVCDLQQHRPFDDSIANLKVLSRAYFSLSEQRISMLNQLTAAVDQVLPGFTRIFNISSKTCVELLARYSSPDALLSSPKEDVASLIRSCSRRSLKYALDKYQLLIQCAKDAKETGITLSALYDVICIYAQNLKYLNDKLTELDEMIQRLAITIPEVSLISSIPGFGKRLSSVIVSEVGDISRFNNAKQLVAYCGIDPSVKQSGNFVGTKNKFTKRGSAYIRKALYIAATISVRKDSKSRCVNPVIYDYYQKKIKSKPKKQALGAVMNKLVRIIFSVLKNKHPFVMITPEEQIKLYRSKAA